MNLRRVTLAQVAAKAGVHVTTVSMALRNDVRLPETTRTRIKKVADEMGYRPDPLLRALVAYRGRVMPRLNPPTIAYLTNWESRWGWKKVPAHLDFFEGAEAKANELGYRIEHFWLHEPGYSQNRIGKIFYNRGISGLVIASHSRERGDELQFDWQHFSAVKIDYFPHQPPLHNVTNNQSSVIRLAVRKVREAGYKRIGFVMHRGWDHAVDRNWTAGFLGEQQLLPRADRVPEHIFPEPLPISRWFNETNPSVVADLEPFQKWLERYKPEVVISKAAYVLPLLEKLKLKIPQDIAFADICLAKGDRSFAGVRQNHEAVGAIAIEILSGQLQHNKFGIPIIPTSTYVEGTWFDGPSCPKR